MKKKYANYHNKEKVIEKDFKCKYFNDEDFVGYICLLTVVKAKERMIVKREGKDVVIIDDNFKWLEVYPENNKNICVSILINDKEEIIDWYFDIAKDTKLTEKGEPYIEDLYLDIILYNSGNIEYLDEDELQDAVNIGDITKDDSELAYKVANELVKKIDGKIKELTDFTYKYYKELKK